MNKQFEGRPNAEALEKQANKYAREAVETILDNKSEIEWIIIQCVEYSRSGHGHNWKELIDKMYELLETAARKSLMQAHKVDGDDPEKTYELLKREYSGINFKELIKNVLGGDGTENDYDLVRALS